MSRKSATCPVRRERMTRLVLLSGGGRGVRLQLGVGEESPLHLVVRAWSVTDGAIGIQIVAGRARCRVVEPPVHVDAGSHRQQLWLAVLVGHLPALIPPRHVK